MADENEEFHDAVEELSAGVSRQTFFLLMLCP